ncbi:hyoscyamine 6-dioxygenase-like [Solanum stenotomum]|uniref:hyoscyamine 6-dioxygenase-like n=1 Tax=Solanum stenotomum TaxID=172797 RepID=UPI0020D1B31C|nr:hyoscyamine 6-dioxygenase-like [Solanum stenotomum]
MASLVSSWSSEVNSIPENYVVPLEKRVNADVPIGKHIPVIDLSQSSTQSIQQIIKASADFGLFQVINHGVSETLMVDALSVCKEFFKLPIEDKAKFVEKDEGLSDFEPSIDQRPKLYIEKEYTPNKDGSNTNNVKDTVFWKDTFGHGCHPLTQDVINSWPEKPQKYREVISEYALELRKLSLRILDLMCEGLGLEVGYFCQEHSQTQLMVTHHYPQCPDPNSTIGIGEHCDGALINLVQQELSGLHVRDKNGKWFGVEPIPGALVVINGLILKVVTNGKLSSGVHRVVTNSTSDRTSLGSLISPIECIIEPAKLLINENNPPLFKSFSYTEYLGYYFSDTTEIEAALKPYKL